MTSFTGKFCFEYRKVLIGIIYYLSLISQIGVRKPQFSFWDKSDLGYEICATVLSERSSVCTPLVADAHTAVQVVVYSLYNFRLVSITSPRLDSLLSSYAAFAFSSRDCVGLLRGLLFPPTVQRHTGKANQRYIFFMSLM